MIKKEDLANSTSTASHICEPELKKTNSGTKPNTNSVDPDEMDRYEPSNLDPHYSPMYIFLSAGMKESIQMLPD